MPDALLTPELLRRLEQFQLLAARRAKSSSKGERRSRARGQSVEFADYRTYVHGDDFRYLDWNLYGRLERLFLKLYEEERELPVRIFLDASESMTFGEPRKFDFARQVAAAIGYVALAGFDRVSVIPFPDLANGAKSDPAVRTMELAARGALRSVRGKKSAIQFFQNLGALSAGGPANLNQALRRGALQARQAGLALVLSHDFRRPPLGGFRNRGPTGGDLWPLPPQGLSADRAEFHAAPARVLPGPRHQLLYRQLEHRFAGTAAQATAPGGGVGVKLSPKCEVRSPKARANGFSSDFGPRGSDFVSACIS